MTDLVAFITTCVASKTLIFSMCGLLIIPLSAWLAVRLLSPFIRRMENDASWQAPLAAIASTTPGAVFLLLAVIDLGGAYSSGCLQFVWGRIFFAVILASVVLSFVRAVTIAHRRQAQVRCLLQYSREPSDRVSAVATRVGVGVRIVPTQKPFCALARPLRPVVLLSHGAIARLDDAELEAALRHEQAHALRGDLLLASALSFFADLLPLPVRNLTSIYSVAREFAADEHAARLIEPQQLASAILSLSGTRSVGNGVAALAENSTSIKKRVIALLDDRAERTGLVGRRIVGTGILAVIAIFSLLPAALSAMNYYACTLKGMSA